MQNAKPTRQPSTELRYGKEALRLLGQYASSGYARSNEGFIDWLNDRNKQIKNETWRSYRAALTFHFKRERNRHEEGDQQYIGYTLILKAIASITHPGFTQPSRCSSKKQKLIDSADLELLLDALDKSTSVYARFTQLMLINGIVLGLRPHEWRHAVLVSKVNKKEAIIMGVRTRNGKYTNGRGNGSHRTVWFAQDFNKPQILLINELITLIKDKELSKPINWSKTYSAARKLLLRVNKATFPKRKRTVSFYSARHQFSADFKNSHDLFSLAAMMGQRSALTPADHYGKKRYGTERPEDLKVFPDLANLAVVQEHASHHASQIAKLRHPAARAQNKSKD